MASALIQILNAGDYFKEIDEAASSLDRGNLLVLPTETVYGIAGRLDLPDVRRKLAEVRGGADDKPLTIHLATPDDARQFLGDTGELAQRMMRKLWPGPVALVFAVDSERRTEVAGRLSMKESELYDGESILLRCPSHPVVHDILSAVGGPVAITQAAVQMQSGSPKPGELATELGQSVERVIDAGPTPFSKPSTIVRVERNSYQILREGVYDQRIIERLLQTTILFVCSGNTCRSPMAAALTRQWLATKLGVSPGGLEAKGYSVISAGVMASGGSPATAQAALAVADLGADLSRHRSQMLTVELIHQADLILAMGSGHARAIRSLVPSASDRIKLLAGDEEIDDPIGGDGELYRSLARQMMPLIESRLRESGLLNLAD